MDGLRCEFVKSTEFRNQSRWRHVIDILRHVTCLLSQDDSPNKSFSLKTVLQVENRMLVRSMSG